MASVDFYRRVPKDLTEVRGMLSGRSCSTHPTFHIEVVIVHLICNGDDWGKSLSLCHKLEKYYTTRMICNAIIQRPDKH